MLARLLFLATGIAAIRLFVSSYDGTLSTIDLARTGDSYSVKTIASTKGCSPSPSWLTLDQSSNTLYCIDENVDEPYPDGKGSINSFSINNNGTLSQTGRVSTSAGPVSAVVIGSKTPALAVAHYDGGAVSVNKLNNNVIGKQITEQFFSHPYDQNGHEVILDPTSKFLVVPDLGGDFVHVYSINSQTSNITQKTGFHMPAGSGPRHGQFLVSGNKTFFYLVAELGNTLTGFDVSYTGDGLSFHQIYNTSTYPGRQPPPYGHASEIQISPDHRFVVVSNRNDSLSATDPIATWKIQPDTGLLDFVQLQSSGGPFPRQFSINAAGDILSAGLEDGRVVFISRDVKSGKLGNILTTAYIQGTITCTVWDE